VDKSSEEALKNILESIPGARVLLIFTYRPEFVHTWGGKSYHSQVNLNRLSNRESLAMMSHLLGTENIESALEEFILEKTEGIPFFIEEFIKSLRDLQIIERKNNTYRISKDIQTVTIPATIQDVIMARVDSLPEGAKEVLQTGSVVGREFSHDLINRVMELTEQELLSNLSVLKDSELVYERGIYPQSTYIFKHALTQDVAYNSLLLKKRKNIHQEIGKTIEQIYPERLEEFYEILAYHYSKSGINKKTYQYFKLSGEKATRNYSNWEAFRFYKEALQALKKETKTEQNLKEQLEILRSMLGPMRILGSPEDSLQILEYGEKLSQELGNEKSLALFHSRLGHYFTIKEGDPLRGIEYCEKSFREAEKIEDIELMAKTGMDLCASSSIAGQHWRSASAASKAIALLEKTKKEHESFGTGNNVYSAMNGWHGLGMGWLGNFEEGEVSLEKGLQFATEINSKTDLGFIEFLSGWFFILKGDGEKAIKHFESAIRYMEEVKYTNILGMAWNGLGWGYYLTGELETAKKNTEKGFKTQSNAGISMWLCYYFLVLSMVHFDSGDLDNAQICIQEALRLSQNQNEKANEGLSKIWLGRILVKADPSKDNNAEKCLLQGINILEELKIRSCSTQGYLFLGELYSDKGETETALKNLKKAEGRFREMGMDYWLSKTQEVLGRLGS